MPTTRQTFGRQKHVPSKPSRLSCPNCSYLEHVPIGYSLEIYSIYCNTSNATEDQFPNDFRSPRWHFRHIKGILL